MRFTIVSVLMVLLAWTGDRALPMSSSAALSHFCPEFNDFVSVRLYDWLSGAQNHVGDTRVAALPLQWDVGESLFRGYDAPFAQPPDAVLRWQVTLYKENGEAKWLMILESEQTPEVNYIYAFQTMNPATDHRGEHYGVHPCRAFRLDARAVERLTAQIDTADDAPALISVHDRRWRRGTLEAVDRPIALYGTPGGGSDEPIQRLETSADVWYATDPSWNGWAQVKLGNVRGWVNLVWVRVRQVRMVSG